MMEAINHICKEAIRQQIFPGCVVGIVDTREQRTILPFGHFTYEKEATKVTEYTPYDLASITKVIPTGLLGLYLIDQGVISKEDTLQKYVPAFSNNHSHSVQIKHLLSYALEGYGLAAQKDFSAAELERYIMTKDFSKAPGEVFRYTNIPAYLMGKVIEAVTKQPLDKVAQEVLFDPLEMKHATFRVPKEKRDTIPPTEQCPWRGNTVQGEVHDESAYVFYKEGITVGHAGLFAPAGDILNVLQMLLQGGTWRGKQLFSESIINEMATNQLDIPGEINGLGWEMGQIRHISEAASARTIAKTGFTGTFMACDLDKGIAYVLLSNRTWPKRPPDSDGINGVRCDLSQAIFSR